MPEVVGDSIDRLCAIEIRYAPAENAVPRGVTTPIFEAARAAARGPMSTLAATRLLERVHAGDRVLVVCGSGSPPFLPYGETDGPLGGAALARALEYGVGAKPVLVSEANMVPANVAAAGAAGLAVHDEAIFRVRPHSALAVAFPGGMDTRPAVEALFDAHRPAAVVFVERTGPNAAGVYHSIRGTAKRPDEIMAGHLVAAVARERGVLTVGIGDGGNEIGFGNIVEVIREVQPAGRRCLCPCGQGVATVVGTDVLVAAAVSNWGAYGVVAMLAYLLGKPDLVQDDDTEYRMLQAAVAAGASDGVYAAPIMAVDGTSWRVQRALVTMLREIVTNGLTPLGRGF